MRKLIKSVHGTRAAAHDRQAEATRTMKDLGSKHISVHVLASALVHGDDFVSSGERAELDWLCKELKNMFETKMVMVGEVDDMAQEARVLNRIVRWHPR